ncbi:MAG TPA: DNA recombination protein RmuC [Balneolales bacterium]|nr:DNA recombination protein RmuC [Balneolales bacterium]
MDILLLIIGLILGAVAAWLIRTFQLRSKMGISGEEAAQLQKQIQDLDLEKSKLGSQLDYIKKEHDELKEQADKKGEDLSSLRERHAGLTADYQNLQEKLADQKKELEELQAKFTESFRNLANEILEEKSKKFTEQNKTQLDQLLQPLSKQIGEFKEKVETTHLEEAKAQASLKQQIIGLSELNQKMTQEANNLVKALKGQTKTQGNWGEMILERILEKSGLRRDYEFEVQKSMKTEDGRRLQPDVVVKLPDDKNIVIDSKVSLNAYEAFSSDEDEDEQNRALQRHILSIKNHVKELGDKSYEKLYEINTPDFVLMFIPIEPAFSLALQNEPGLFNEAFEKNIVIVSPSTLLATLATINNVWKQEYQNRNAQDIARQSANLYDKFVGFVDDLQKIGERIQQTQVTYDQAMNKLQTGRGNLIGRVEKLKKLGISPSKQLPGNLLDGEEDEE